MMLTVKQPPTYGYKSLHDLPTPPSTSRLSPPLTHRDSHHPTSYPFSTGNRSPVRQPMSAPPRGLPPPAAMALPSQQPPSSSGPPPPHHQQPPPPSQHQQQQQQPSQHWTTLPAPPQHWSGTEEPMRNWLQARAEEEKTRQEEEKTRQEGLRLEQRRIEMEMLRASLGGGIPPPMVPLVFAGMSNGGLLPQAAIEWAQQFMPPSQTHHLQQLMPAQGPMSPQHQRDLSSSSHSQYAGAGAATGSSYAPYPASPTRQRGQTVSGPVGRQVDQPSSLPSMAPVVQQGGPTSSGLPSHQGQPPPQVQPGQQEAGPSIYFHHWQPPTTQAGSSSTRAGSPSGETPRKRRATGAMQPGQAATEQRLRSPPPFVQSGSSSPPGGRKGLGQHRRQRSDVSWYRPPLHGRAAEERGRSQPDASPPHRSTASASRDDSEPPRKKHSVSSLLSTEPSASDEAAYSAGRSFRPSSHAHTQSYETAPGGSGPTTTAEQPHVRDSEGRDPAEVRTPVPDRRIETYKKEDSREEEL